MNDCGDLDLVSLHAVGKEEMVSRTWIILPLLDLLPSAKNLLHKPPIDNFSAYF